MPSGCVAGIAVSRPTGTKNAASTRASISKSCTTGQDAEQADPDSQHGQHHADQEALQRRGRIVQGGEQAAGRRRQRSRAAAGRPAGADPEGAYHQDRERRREARQQGEAVIVVQLLRRMGVHGERCGRGRRRRARYAARRSRMSCRRSTSWRSRCSRLPRITSFQPARGSVSASHRAMDARIRSASLRGGGSPGADPDAQIRQQLLQRTGSPRRPPATRPGGHGSRKAAAAATPSAAAARLPTASPTDTCEVS